MHSLLIGMVWNANWAGMSRLNATLLGARRNALGDDQSLFLCPPHPRTHCGSEHERHIRLGRKITCSGPDSDVGESFGVDWGNRARCALKVGSHWHGRNEVNPSDRIQYQIGNITHYQAKSFTEWVLCIFFKGITAVSFYTGYAEIDDHERFALSKSQLRIPISQYHSNALHSRWLLRIVPECFFFRPFSVKE